MIKFGGQWGSIHSFKGTLWAIIALLGCTNHFPWAGTPPTGIWKRQPQELHAVAFSFAGNHGGDMADKACVDERGVTVTSPNLDTFVTYFQNCSDLPSKITTFG